MWIIAQISFMNIVLVDENQLLTDTLRNLLLLMPEVDDVETYLEGKEFSGPEKFYSA
jgi:hypothetical protein